MAFGSKGISRRERRSHLSRSAVQFERRLQRPLSRAERASKPGAIPRANGNVICVNVHLAGQAVRLPDV